MEENLDRRSEIVELQVATINEMLKPLLVGRKVIAAEVLTAGRANTNYKLCLSGASEPLVLRLYVRDPNVCLKEYNLFKALHNIVPMAEVLYVEFDPARFGFAYSVLRWVEGVHLDKVITITDDNAASQLGQELGSILAAIGSYHFGQPGLFGQSLTITYPFTSTVNSWFSFIKRCLSEGHTGTQLGPIWSQKLEQFVDDNVGYLADLPEDNCLLHADFRETNIMVRQVEDEWKVAAVLDWEFAYSGSPLADMGPLLRYDTRYNPAFEKHFTQGFTGNGGKLPDDWKRKVRLLDLLNLCDLLNRPQISLTMRDEVSQLIIDTITKYS